MKRSRIMVGNHRLDSNSDLLPGKVLWCIIYRNVEFSTLMKWGRLMSSSQISANISAETRELLERYVAAHGVKKSHLIETAVLHYLSALDSIPADLIIPPVVEVSRTTGDAILELIEKPKPATVAMRALFDD